MPHLNTEFFISRRISSAAVGKNNVMVRIASATVAVGMAVIIIALAVVTGFKQEITGKLVGFSSHVRVVSLHANNSLETDPITIDSALMDTIKTLPRFKSIAPYAMKGGIIKTQDAIQGVAMKGLSQMSDSAFLQKHLIRGRLPNLSDSTRRKELLISENISKMLGLDVDDRVEMLFISPSRPVHRDRFKVSGVYRSGMDELDNSLIFTDIRNVQRLNGWGIDKITGYEVQTTDFDRVEDFAEDTYGAIFDNAENTTEVLKVEDIISLNPNTFDWLKAHNMNALVIIIIMLLVAFLNMLSAMLIILLEKTSMIGVLKALGMRNKAVQKIFILRSLRIIFTGVFWGNIAGLGLCLLQKYTGLVTLDSSGYMLSEVPINLGWEWLVAINIGVPLVMLVFMIIPAGVVSAIKPDRTIRYQ